MKNEINKYRTKNSPDTSKVTDKEYVQGKAEKNQNKKTKSTVLLLADSQGRGLANQLQVNLGKDFSVNGIFKPNATFENVTAEVKSMTSNLTSEDFLIILAGSNNALDGKTVTTDNLSTISNIENTNVIIIAVPYWKGRSVLNEFTYNINLQIYNELVVGKQNFSLFDINTIMNKTDFTFHGRHLNSKGKKKLSFRLSQLITQTERSISNKMQWINYSNLITISENVTSINSNNNFQLGHTASSALYPNLPQTDEELQGFRLHRQSKDRYTFTSGKEKGGGVLVAVPEIYKSEQIHISHIFRNIDMVCVKIANNSYHFYLLVLYVPPAQKVNEYEELFEYVSSLYFLLDSNLLILGDLNIPELAYYQNNPASNSQDLNTSLFLKYDTEYFEILERRFTEVPSHYNNADNKLYPDIISNEKGHWG
ncbi:hypothetical protein ILUMI_08798 [Ignelater luminosus]|uniref:Endonuclease/exonuclease/phosphatase domain-containing protein n=1 Tax=Ignelater luminosus TaxID=2038154 RepID=A0A8K0D5G5_IGNLU|nr:hypothetical protein ILUMI_08798 [Ignelater luminosus]